MPNGSYSWITLSDAISQLGQRLNITPSSSSFWTENELQVYICQSLRIFNSLVWQWRTDFNFNSPNLWNSLGSLTGSPRLRTLTDNEIYAELEFMLLEPSNTTGTWTGTNQFSISDLSQALQRRRDEMLQVSNANQSLMTGIALTPNTIRTYLPDSVIDVERIRYIPVTGSPNTLYRDDSVANEWYEAPLYQQNSGTPQTFSLSSEPPLSFQVDIPPAQPGTYEAVVLQSGAPFNPPTATLLGIPNDFSFVLEWGALADLLGRESEATDRERAAYALQRYQDGLILMQKTPWIELGKVNGQAVSIDSIVAMDRFDCEWDSNPTGFGPVIVAGGIDFLAAPVSQNIGVTVLGNAPVPTSGTDFIQCSRSDMDIVYDLAQARAAWKQGGAEFKAALELEKRAIQMCASENVRLKSLGAFSDVLDQRGQAQERDMNRYNDVTDSKKRSFQKAHPEYF